MTRDSPNIHDVMSKITSWQTSLLWKINHSPMIYLFTYDLPTMYLWFADLPTILPMIHLRCTYDYDDLPTIYLWYTYDLPTFMVMFQRFLYVSQRFLCHFVHGSPVHHCNQVHKPLEDTVQAVKPGKTQGHYLRRGRRGKKSASVWYVYIIKQ